MNKIIYGLLGCCFIACDDPKLSEPKDSDKLTVDKVFSEDPLAVDFVEKVKDRYIVNLVHQNIVDYLQTNNSIPQEKKYDEARLFFRFLTNKLSSITKEKIDDRSIKFAYFKDILKKIKNSKVLQFFIDDQKFVIAFTIYEKLKSFSIDYNEVIISFIEDLQLNNEMLDQIIEQKIGNVLNQFKKFYDLDIQAQGTIEDEQKTVITEKKLVITLAMCKFFDFNFKNFEDLQDIHNFFMWSDLFFSCDVRGKKLYESIKDDFKLYSKLKNFFSFMCKYIADLQNYAPNFNLNKNDVNAHQVSYFTVLSYLMIRNFWNDFSSYKTEQVSHFLSFCNPTDCVKDDDDKNNLFCKMLKISAINSCVIDLNKFSPLQQLLITEVISEHLNNELQNPFSKKDFKDELDDFEKNKIPPLNAVTSALTNTMSDAEFRNKIKNILNSSSNP